MSTHCFTCGANYVYSEKEEPLSHYCAHDTRQTKNAAREVVTIAVDVHGVELTAQLGDGWSGHGTWIR